jgi:hypothetical protein
MGRLVAFLFFVAAACAPTLTSTSDTPAPVAPRPAPIATGPAIVAPAVIASPTPPVAPSPTPTPTLGPRDSALLARLAEWCALLRPGASPPRPPLPLDIVAALSDGRSGRELVAVLGRANCGLPARTWGEDAAEVVAMGDYVGPGALLWVDRGAWRIARLPSGYVYQRLFADREIAGGRELYLGIDSGGSAGDVGVLALRIVGKSATIILDARLGSQLGAMLLDDDHLLVSARKLPIRPWGWTQNCCLPGGHQWLYERRDGRFVLTAERQMIGPEFALNAFVGAMAAGRADLAVDVGTATAIANAARLITQPDYWAGDFRLFGESDREEALRWDALPNPLRLDRREVTATVGHYGLTGGIDRAYIATLGYVDGGWRVTNFGLPQRGGPS